jgi:hypothetical protein
MDIQVLPQTSPWGRSALQSFWVAALSMILFFPLFATASQGDDTGWILFFALGVGLVLGGLFFAFLRANSTRGRAHPLAAGPHAAATNTPDRASLRRALDR